MVKEAEIVKLIFRLYTRPDSSTLKVAKELRKLGHRTKTGRDFGSDTVHNIVRDPIYIGEWFANRYSDNGTKLKPREEWIEVKVPHIVGREVFEKAKKLLKQRRNCSAKNVKREYLLQGMVKCGVCGNKIAGLADKDFEKRNGKVYGPYHRLYYRCVRAVKNRFGKVVNCDLRYVRADVLERAVWEKMKELLKNPALIEEAIKSSHDISQKTQQSLKKEVKAIEKQWQGLKKEEDRILEAYRHDIISMEQLESQIGHIRERSQVRNSLQTAI